MRPLIVFAHGAGAPSSSAWMLGWARRLGSLGDVVTFDYPYMRQGRKAPDRTPVLLAAHREAIGQAAKRHPRAPLILAGKSMGSRMGCHVASIPEHGDPTVAGLICFGYPLVGISGALRDEVLVSLRTPVLFVQGTRDRLCPLDRLMEVRARMQARNDLFVVEGGDHSLAIPKRAGVDAAGVPRTQAGVDTEILAAAQRFVRSVDATPAGEGIPGLGVARGRS